MSSKAAPSETTQVLAHRVQGPETEILAYLLIRGSPTVPNTVILQEIENGLLPKEFGLVGSMVQDICYRNAARYFDFGLPVD